MPSAWDEAPSAALAGSEPSKGFSHG